MPFPTSPPSNTDPTPTNKLASPSHSQLHQSHNAEIVAIEAKVGTGASTPTSGKVLRATGTGTSAWGQTVLSTDVATATSADLMGILSDETGTGAAVFGTAPTLGSPAITTPSITTSINDSNGNEIIKTPATASATNEITVTNAANGSSPTISATGSSDTNVDLTLTPKGTGTIKTSPVNRIDWTALPLGTVVQVVSTNFSAVATGTTVLPYDDTIPQITEGDQYITQAFTPKSATNRLSIELKIYVSNSVINDLSAALFQDAVANALSATTETTSVAGGSAVLSMTHDMLAATVSAITFRVRAGGSLAGTTTFSGTGGARKFGGITTSNIRIIEYKA